LIPRLREGAKGIVGAQDKPHISERREWKPEGPPLCSVGEKESILVKLALLVSPACARWSIRQVRSGQVRSRWDGRGAPWISLTNSETTCLADGGLEVPIFRPACLPLILVCAPEKLLRAMVPVKIDCILWCRPSGRVKPGQEARAMAHKRHQAVS
jgi:hypothetical protein